MRRSVFFFVVSAFFHCIASASSAGAIIRIMPVGDSITSGESSGESSPERWVSYRKALLDKLMAAGYEVDFVGSLNSGSTVLGVDAADHEGHGGWTDAQIVDGKPDEPAAGKLDEWLIDYRPDVVLLHIGTNEVDPSPDDVSRILDAIDDYESSLSVQVWVILALIIKRSCDPYAPPCPNDDITTEFNNNVSVMATARILGGDLIKMVDMEDGAGIDYRLRPQGDMFDFLHPYQYGAGYGKMADVWFSALQQVLPDPQPDPNPGNTRNSDGDSSGCFISSAANALF